MGDLRERTHLKTSTRKVTDLGEKHAPAGRRPSAPWRWVTFAALGVVLLVIVFGVMRARGGDDSNKSGSTQPSTQQPAPPASQGFTVEQMTAFSQCMSAQGLDMSDPKVAADGRVDPMKPGPGVDPGGPAFQKGLRSCEAKFSADAGGGHP